MQIMKASGSKIHMLWKAYMRFLIKIFIFFIPLVVFNSIFEYIIGAGTVSTILSLLLSILLYLKISRKYAKKLIENLYLEKNLN